jgi:UDP-N-acetylmuramate--alanine ligase
VDETFAAFLALAPIAVVGDEPGLPALAGGGAAGGAGADGGAGTAGAGGRQIVIARAEDVRLEPGGSRFVVDGVEVMLPVPGAHNARNAAAALTACRLAGADLQHAAAALADFAGAGRRFERLGATAAGAVVVDDYAHHPTEVRATIAAARTLAPGRVVAAFQPHLFSRTAREARAFGAALAEADLAVVLDVYPARERPEDFPGVSGLLVAEAAADAAGGRRVVWLPTLESAAAFLAGELRDGDLLLTLGAGDVDRLGRMLVAGESRDRVETAS